MSSDFKNVPIQYIDHKNVQRRFLSICTETKTSLLLKRVRSKELLHPWPKRSCLKHKNSAAYQFPSNPIKKIPGCPGNHLCVNCQAISMSVQILPYLQRMDVYSPDHECERERGEKRKSSRVQRACFNCRKRKQGCEEERPCRRCVEKGVECEEVEVKRKRGRIKSKKSFAREDEKEPQTEAQNESSSSMEEYIGWDSSSEEDNATRSSEHLPISALATTVEFHETVIPKAKESVLLGLNLGQLLPFLVNLVWETPHLDPDSFSWVDESFSDIFDVSFSTQQELYLSLSSGTEEKVKEGEEGEGENGIFWQIREWWNSIKLALAEDPLLRQEFEAVKGLWQEIMLSLRSWQWEKVRSYLLQIEAASQLSLTSPDPTPALVVWSSGGRIHHANAAFCRLVGYTIEELLAHPDMSQDENGSKGSLAEMPIRAHALFHPEEIVGILQRQLEALQRPSRSAFHLKTRLLSKTRKEISGSLSVSNVRDSMGSALTVAHFITSH